MSGSVGYHAGLAAEAAVRRHYERRGLALAAERWRGQGGEIDLILKEGDAVIFVEVKKSRSHAGAAARVSQRQMQRIYSAASEYLETCPRGQLTEARFDVALVDQSGGIEVLENAFGAL